MIQVSNEMTDGLNTFDLSHNISFNTFVIYADVEKIYRERLDYKEGMTDIFNALAAKELGDLARFKDSAANSNNRDETDCERRVVDFLGRAENQIRGHPYSYLIKGFYEIRQGSLKSHQNNRYHHIWDVYILTEVF